MPINFDSFQEWEQYCTQENIVLWKPVVEYEMIQRNRTEQEVWDRISAAYLVMCEAIETGLTQNMTSRSGMINNGAKKIRDCTITVLSEEFKTLLVKTIAAKELNSCMGRIVAAPTAGASGIVPGVLSTLQEIHHLPNQIIYEGMLVAAGIALIIERRASISGSVGGCQAETGAAAAMGAGAIVYCLKGSIKQVFDAVAITIMNMLGLVCDPIAGLVEVPCVKRNGSAAVIAFSAAQIALAGDPSIIPVDEVVDTMGEIGQNMDISLKETALGGLAATPSGKAIAEKVLNRKIVPEELIETPDTDEIPN
ncbi:MAG: L-serine ammonia-lyase, iron-sulfur-dependent, subunit alpha [Bacteroidia bacterium]|nr:L-serine ammonia-lyase, iron-sulfur-dependent, subunit alpha [Bacteroidia bacterium]